MFLLSTNSHSYHLPGRLLVEKRTSINNLILPGNLEAVFGLDVFCLITDLFILLFLEGLNFIFLLFCVMQRQAIVLCRGCGRWHLVYVSDMNYRRVRL